MRAAATLEVATLGAGMSPEVTSVEVTSAEVASVAGTLAGVVVMAAMVMLVTTAAADITDMATHMAAVATTPRVRLLVVF